MLRWWGWGTSSVRIHAIVSFSCQKFKSKRLYSRDREVERLDILCGSSGSITIDIFNKQALWKSSNPLILYLPPTGTHNKTQHPPIPSHLFNPNTTLARINYRWNIASSPSSTPKSSSTPTYLSSHPLFKNHAFPNPLHDVLHAYEHLVSTILPPYSPTPQPTSTPPLTRRSYAPTPALSHLNTTQRPIIIYGSFLGGTLATSLALTESRTSRTSPITIKALVVKNGVFDFSILTTSAFSTTPTSASSESEPTPEISEGEEGLKGEAWTSSSLHALKKTLFSSPEQTFDAFASPILFFRTSGLHIPKVWPGEPRLPTNPLFSQSTSPQNNQNEPHIWADGFEGYDSEGTPIYSSPPPPSSLSSTSSSSTSPESTGIRNVTTGKTTTEISLDPPPRKSHLKYPPPNTDLIIPPTLFLYSSTSPSSTSSKLIKPSSRSPKKPKMTMKQIKQELGLTGPSPESQAIEMRTLMVRSVVHYELKDSEEGDKRGVGEGRVCVEGVDGGGEGADGEGSVVRDWIEELL